MPINSRVKGKDTYMMSCKHEKNGNGQFEKKDYFIVVQNDLAFFYDIHGFMFFTDTDIAIKIRKYGIARYADGYYMLEDKGKKIALHRYITQAPCGTVVDHINQNKQDNRMKNLRITNKSENAYNSKIRKSNTSGITGVYFRKDTQRWSAEIKKNGEKICLGCFGSKEEAALARANAEEQYYGYKLKR